MNAYASSGESFSRSVERVMQSVHVELQQAVRYMDKVVVPEIRRESGSALRVLARRLDHLADTLHRDTPRGEDLAGKSRS